MPYTVTFWGTRGSIPTPGPKTARYGGNTPCVAVAGQRDELVILDAGTGIRPLGRELAQNGNGGINADILVSHTHWDHIQGLPFFRPLNIKGNSVRIYGAPQGGFGLESILDRQMDPMVFPIPLRALAADLRVTEISDDAFEVDGFSVKAFRLRHPGTTLGFRLTPVRGGPSMAYLTDNELGDAATYEVPADWRKQLTQWLGGVDTLIHDAMYTEEMIEQRVGWGHSTPRQAVELAQECGVRHLVLFHHEPDHDDSALDRLLAGARKDARDLDPGLQVDAAIEGMRLDL